jgi:hypothetical protein
VLGYVRGKWIHIRWSQLLERLILKAGEAISQFVFNPRNMFRFKENIMF